MKASVILGLLLIAMVSMSCTWSNSAARVNSKPNTSLVLQPRTFTFELSKVPQGAVAFTATIKNEGATTLTIAHPSICFPADYKQEEISRLNYSHGKSEILLKITKPDGADLILRDGYFHYFDPGNVSLITIPPHASGTFEVGWFFENARGRWEKDKEAAKAFRSKGRYQVSLLFRNVFPKAARYDESAKEVKFIDVWTGEMESAEITIAVN
jgi:hypothetical protein